MSEALNLNGSANSDVGPAATSLLCGATSVPEPCDGIRNGTRSLLHETARAYAEAGVPVFPCLPGAKEPATGSGFKDATTDLGQIDAWWSERPDYNVAIEPERAGWAVVDVDPEGLEALPALDLPPTHTVRTPRGGVHLYFAGSIAPSASKLARGIDTRGRGSYVLVPPSVTADGVYATERDVDPVPLPERISEAAGRRRERAERAGDGALDTAANIHRAEMVIAATEDAVEGAGSDAATYSLAATLIDLVSPETALRLMWDRWVPRCVGEWDQEWLAEKIAHAVEYRQNAVGAYAVDDTALKATARELASEQAKHRDTLLDDEASPKFKCYWPDEGASLPKAEYHDPNKLLPKGGLVLISGPPGSHKTNVVAHMALAANHDHGAKIAFCEAEGISDFLNARIPAQCAVQGIDPASLRGEFLTIDGCPQIPAGDTEVDEVSALAREKLGRDADMFVIDTLSEATAGSDENAAKDMSLVVRAVNKLRKDTGATVIIPHHTGKDLAKGARGSTVLTAAVDVALETSFDRSTSIVTVHVKKHRFGPAGYDVLYRATIVDGTMTVVPLTTEEAADAKRAVQCTTTADAHSTRRGAVAAALAEMGAYGADNSVSRQHLAQRLAGDPQSYSSAGTSKMDACRKAVVEWETYLDNGSRARGKHGRRLLAGFFEPLMWPPNTAGSKLEKRWFLPAEDCPDVPWDTDAAGEG